MGDVKVPTVVAMVGVASVDHGMEVGATALRPSIVVTALAVLLAGTGVASPWFVGVVGLASQVAVYAYTWWMRREQESLSAALVEKYGAQNFLDGKPLVDEAEQIIDDL